MPHIPQGMWAEPDDMKSMLDQKDGQLKAGASTAWVPSPIAATLHSLHYLRIGVAQVQSSLLAAQQQSDNVAAVRAQLRDAILTPPLVGQTPLSPSQVQAELDNNVQGLLGYVVRCLICSQRLTPTGPQRFSLYDMGPVSYQGSCFWSQVRWVGAGVGCSKVPNLQNVQLMEDRSPLPPHSLDPPRPVRTRSFLRVHQGYPPHLQSAHRQLDVSRGGQRGAGDGHTPSRRRPR